MKGEIPYVCVYVSVYYTNRRHDKTWLEVQDDRLCNRHNAK